MPDSSVASRRAAARRLASPGSQWPPSWTHRWNRLCNVSSVRSPVASSTSAEAVRWPGTHSRAQASSGRASRKARKPNLRARWASSSGSHAASSAAATAGATTPAARPSAGRGRRGLGGHADGDGPERLPVGRQGEDAAHDVGGEDRRSDPARAEPLGGQRDQERLHRRSPCHREHRAFALAAGVVGVGVHAVAGAEGEDELGGAAQEVAAAHAALDLVGGPSVGLEVLPPAVRHGVQQRGAALADDGEPDRRAVVRCGRGQCDADRAAERGEVDRLVGERADRPAREHGLAAALGERLLGAEAEQVLVEGADEVAGGRAVVGRVQAAHDGDREPAELALDQVGGARELVGHRDLGDQQLVALPVDHAAVAVERRRRPPRRSRRRSARSATSGPSCR